MTSHSEKCRSVLAKLSFQSFQLFRELVGYYDKACGLYANLHNSATEILTLARASGYPASGGPYRYRGALSMFDPKLSVRILIKHTEQFNKSRENMPLLLDGIKSVQEKMIKLQNQILTLVESSYPQTKIGEFLTETCPMYPVSIQEHLQLRTILQSLVAMKLGALIESQSVIQRTKIEDLILSHDIPALEKFVSELSSYAETWTPLSSFLKDELVVASRIRADTTVTQWTCPIPTVDADALSDLPGVTRFLRENVVNLHNLALRITNVGLVPWLEAS